MKKFVFYFSLIISTLILAACNLDDMERHNLMTPEELVAQMNKNLGNHFTLVDYDEEIHEYKDDDANEYKSLVVTLKADDLPNQVVKAYQIFQWSFGDDRLYDISNNYTHSARTTIAYVEEYLVTDYYFLKYKDELFSKIKELYKPLLNELNENEDYILVIKPNIRSFPITNTHFYSQNNFSDATDILKNAGISTHLLVHTENYPDEKEMKSFFKTISDYGYNSDCRKCFYYSKKYSPSNVTEEALVKGTFYKYTDFEKNMLVEYVEY